MIKTGLDRLDEFLLGGLPGGAITDIYGSPGTGKTQFLFHLSFNVIRGGNRVLYIDTSGTFRPERIAEIQQNNSAPNTLDRITVLRVTNTSEQTGSLQTIEDSGFDAVLIDNITDLFSYEYQDSRQVFERNTLFMQYMYDLSLCAIHMKIPIVITNMMRQAGETLTENMQAALDPFTHIKIMLSRDMEDRGGRASWMGNSLEFSYNITPEGLKFS